MENERVRKKEIAKTKSLKNFKLYSDEVEILRKVHVVN